MKRRKRRLNPIYWIIQFLGGLLAIGSLFWIPYLVEKIVNYIGGFYHGKNY